MSGVAFNNVPRSDQKIQSDPASHNNVIQGQPSKRRSSPNTPMLECKWDSKQTIKESDYFYRAPPSSSMIQRLSSGTRILSSSDDILISFTPHQQAALGVHTSPISPEAEAMIHTAIQAFEELSQQCKESK